MNMWEKLQNIDPRWYYYLLVLVVALPIIKPWELPIKVGPEARSFLRDSGSTSARQYNLSLCWIPHRLGC